MGDYPAIGKILYSTRQTKAMTASQDNVDLTVPDNKIWWVHYIYIRNESTQTILCGVEIQDSSNNLLTTPFAANLSDNGTTMIPYKEGTEDIDRLGHGAWPILMTGGQILRIYFGAHASKADNGYWYAMIREL